MDGNRQTGCKAMLRAASRMIEILNIEINDDDDGAFEL